MLDEFRQFSQQLLCQLQLSVSAVPAVQCFLPFALRTEHIIFQPRNLPLLAVKLSLFFFPLLQQLICLLLQRCRFPENVSALSDCLTTAFKLLPVGFKRKLRFQIFKQFLLKEGMLFKCHVVCFRLHLLQYFTDFLLPMVLPVLLFLLFIPCVQILLLLCLQKVFLVLQGLPCYRDFIP